VLTLLPAAIEDYAIRHSTSLPPLLSELIEETKREMGDRALMLTGQLEGYLLQLLVASVGAKRVLEVGMFTGFSAQMMAAALPEDGTIITCDIDAKAIEIAKRYFERSDQRQKFDIREGAALETIKTLQPPFDFVFIDADKANYLNYYEACLPLLSPEGLMAVDNVLWSGKVLEPEDDDTRAIVAFNQHVQQDARVTNVLLTVRDGIMLIQKNEETKETSGTGGDTLGSPLPQSGIA
jgi:caffeoyl-CoA O-methyltransferase